MVRFLILTFAERNPHLMKNILFALLLMPLASIQAQDILGAQILIEKGIELHDKGLYTEAIAQYDSALVIDPQNVAAMAEKAMSLLSDKKPQEAANLCDTIIINFEGARHLELVYITYGNALDELGKPQESIEIYNQGLKHFPNNAHLHFNKGITLTGLDRFDEAQKSIEKALSINPYHAGSHNALARILVTKKKDAMALMALTRFLIIEPEGKRALNNLPLLEDILKANVKTKGKKKDKVVTITLNPMDITNEDNGVTTENDFRMAELMLSMSAALDFEKKNKRQSQAERIQRIMTTFFSGLSETKRDNFGFYWEYYVPYFEALQKADLIEPLSYIVLASRREKPVLKWIKVNRNKIDEFYEWDKQYEW